MRFHALACVLAGGLALEAAAGPVPAGPDARRSGMQAHVIVDTVMDSKVVVDSKVAVDSKAVDSKVTVDSKAAVARRHLPPPPPPPPPPARPSLSRRVPETHTLHERQPTTWARSWQRVARAPADAVLPMRIGLQARNLDAGHARLMALSDPASPHYGRHMTAAEVVAFFAPERAAVDAVVGWLTAGPGEGGAGIDIHRVSLSANKQWIQFDARVAEAEALLHTEFHVFAHRDTGTRDVAADHYHVPRRVQPHIDYITPGIRLRKDVDKARALHRRRQAEAQKKDEKRSFWATHTDPVYYAGGRPGGRIGVEAAAVNSPPPLNASTCYRYVTPDCIRAQYDIPLGTTAQPGNELGVFEALGQHYSKEDLDTYFAALAPQIPAGTYPQERLVDGATGAAASVAEAGSEAELDFQAAMPLIYPQQAVLFQVDDERIQAAMTSGSSPYLGFWNTFFDAIDGSYCTYSAFGETGNCVRPECLDPAYPDAAPGGYNGSLQCGVYQPTNVISISYGGGEADLPASYWKRQCSEILKLGLQGVTVVIASGDFGVAAAPYDTGHYDGCAGDQGQIFYPGSEATCPYVLAVGSTEFALAEPLNSTAANGTNSTTGGAPYGNGTSSSSSSSAAPPRLTERATSRFGSGGGFSNYFAQPAYQSAAVAQYMDTVTLPFSGYADMGNGNFSGAGAGVFHLGGRGYPDVAAVGDHYVTLLNGGWALLGGTSLSAPVWAAVLTRINEVRLAAGKRPVGFVNPVLYRHPEVFHDVTAGSNPGCGTAGFPAAAGWDPVTGLGTPDFPKLVALFAGLP